MSIVTIIVTLALVGFVLWLVITYIPMPEPIKRVIVIATVILLVLWLINGLGLLVGVNQPIRLGR